MSECVFMSECIFYDQGWNEALSCVNIVPSADVVEVVRCKDCKFWDSDCIWCELWGNTQEYGNGFCSYGERKDNE